MKLNQDHTVAVSTEVFWEPMSTCPRGVKVQLLNPGAVATHGSWDGKDTQWLGWCAMPRKQKEQGK